jgi:hypothetical protein
MKHDSGFLRIRGADRKSVETDGVLHWIRDTGDGWRGQVPADTVSQGHLLVSEDSCRIQKTIQNLLERPRT